MRRLARLLVPVLAGLLLTGWLASPASAAPPADYEGRLSVRLPSIGFADVANTGTVNHFQFSSTTDLTGDVVGVSRVDMSCIGYEEPFQRSFTCHGTLLTSGVVASTGAAFTTTARGHFRCSFDTGRCRGSSVLHDGTGAFAGVRGVTKTDQNAFTGVGTYTINVSGRG